MIKSIAFHVIWGILSIAFRIVVEHSTDIRTLKFSLAVYFYYFVFIMCFDSTMAIVYVTHIKQSLTTGMILRYSGWGTDLKLKSYDDFGGWLPITASACWLRGVLIYMLNLYCCRVLSLVRQTTVRTVYFEQKLNAEQYHPIPEAGQVEIAHADVLVYRLGETEPQVTGIFNF